MRNKIIVNPAPSFYLLLATMLLVLPFSWLIAAVIAGAYHEMCHILAIRLCSGSIHRLDISQDKARLTVSPLSPLQELICALSGPFGGLLLLLLSCWIPRIAICAATQSLYNLLPIYPLDGGRALRCGLSILAPEKIAEKICKCTEAVCLTGLILISLYGAIRLKLGFYALIPATLIICNTKLRKTPCKQWRKRLQ